jgi:glutamyl-tRNA synthetase
MRTTLVIRGEEWLASLPIHIQLFDLLGFKRPKYGHTAQLMKLEDGRKRKLSKRLDPELSLEYYKQQGYHPLAVRAYLLTLLNSNFEEWFIANPDDSIEDFRFSIENMGVSGALFDILKLNDVSKTIISKMDSNDVIEFLRDWIKEYNASALSVIFKSEDYLKRIIELGMGVGSKKPRKDYISASQIFEMISYYFGEYFKPTYEYSFEKDTVINILNRYTEIYNHSDDNSQWFDKIKNIADEFGFAVKLGDYKKNPEAYKGYVGDVAEIIRISVTGQKNTPDLWSIMQIIGEDCVRKRILETIEHLNHID